MKVWMLMWQHGALRHKVQPLSILLLKVDTSGLWMNYLSVVQTLMLEQKAHVAVSCTCSFWYLELSRDRNLACKDMFLNRLTFSYVPDFPSPIVHQCAWVWLIQFISSLGMQTWFTNLLDGFICYNWYQILILNNSHVPSFSSSSLTLTLTLTLSLSPFLIHASDFFIYLDLVA